MDIFEEIEREEQEEILMINGKAEDRFVIPAGEEGNRLADWAVEKYKEAQEEHDRLYALADLKISELQQQKVDLDEKFKNSTKVLRTALTEYFETVKSKETKTQKSYKLLSGTLVYKKPTQKMEHDDEKLIQYLWNNDMDEFVENKPKVKWAELKKNLQIVDDQVVDTATGAVVEGVTVEDVPASFEIK